MAKKRRTFFKAKLWYRIECNGVVERFAVFRLKTKRGKQALMVLIIRFWPSRSLMSHLRFSYPHHSRTDAKCGGQKIVNFQNEKSGGKKTSKCRELLGTTKHCCRFDAETSTWRQHGENTYRALGDTFTHELVGQHFAYTQTVLHLEPHFLIWYVFEHW